MPLAIHQPASAKTTATPSASKRAAHAARRATKPSAFIASQAPPCIASIKTLSNPAARPTIAS